MAKRLKGNKHMQGMAQEAGVADSGEQGEREEGEREDGTLD